MPCKICGKDGPLSDKAFCAECTEKLKRFSDASSTFHESAAAAISGIDFSDAAAPAESSEREGGAIDASRVTGRFGHSDAFSLRNPFSLAINFQGNIMVMDRPEKGKYRVALFTPGGEYLRTLMELQQGNGPAELKYPKGIAADPHGNIYVPDAGNCRIQRFDERGTPLGPIGGRGAGPGAFDFPCDVEIDKTGSLYVADTYNCRIQKLTPQGVMLLCIGEAANDGGDSLELNEPEGVTVDRAGNIFIADTSNHRLVKCDPQGKLLLQFGKEGTSRGGFVSPSDVRVLDDGSIYLADMDNCRVQKFDASGRFLAAFALEKTEQGAHVGGDIAVDSEGCLLICDVVTHTVVRVELLGSI